MQHLICLQEGEGGGGRLKETRSTEAWSTATAGTAAFAMQDAEYKCGQHQRDPARVPKQQNTTLTSLGAANKHCKAASPLLLLTMPSKYLMCPRQSHPNSRLLAQKPRP